MQQVLAGKTPRLAARGLLRARSFPVALRNRSGGFFPATRCLSQIALRGGYATTCRLPDMPAMALGERGGRKFAVSGSVVKRPLLSG